MWSLNSEIPKVVASAVFAHTSYNNLMEQMPCPESICDTDECPVFRQLGKCGLNTHHLIFPKRLFKSKVEKEYRELDENKIKVCQQIHRMIHCNQPALTKADKPTRDEMLAAIDESKRH